MANTTGISEKTRANPGFSKGTDEFRHYNQILDIITYSFCIIGIILNFFAFGILRRKATMGVLLIKLILISDGLVCLFYLLNQTWTDIWMKYFSNSMVSFQYSKKSIPTHISNILRKLAITATGVSNWYVVIMIVHRCVSIYMNPLRSRIDRSLWAFVQKPTNLWIAFGACWIFGLIQAFLLPYNNQITLDVFMYVLPLILVFIFSVSLLFKLRKIHTNTDPANTPSMCCFSLHGVNKSHKGDSDETFTQIRPATLSAENRLRSSEEIQTNPSTRSKRMPAEMDRKKTYHRITMTILSLAISFVILDSMQLIDLLIRIPWDALLGGIERVPANETGLDVYVTEVKSKLKQHVMSIVKNTCTLGKTLANFIILCAHSRHFRVLVSVKFRRFRRFFKVFKYRYSRSAHAPHGGRNLWFIPSIRRSTIHHKPKDANIFVHTYPDRSPSRMMKLKMRKQRASSSSGSSLAHSLFRQKRGDNEGYVVHKFRKPLRKSDLPQILIQSKSRDNGSHIMPQNNQAQLSKQKELGSTLTKNNVITIERTIHDDYFHKAMKQQFASASYQQTSNSIVENVVESDNEKSICTICENKPMNFSFDSLSLVSNLTFPGAFRAHCCDCQKVKASEICTKSAC
ncbi:unnamed protein product [Rodentolepis nana]|uniref:G_PROTEIN_RECEP_F1_2 domain-containing protein n=1 Tax=Rodentolepis nana TaxID=102285 RepID=A0A0R3TSH8_RODNA|nr:unnamed protein product [Rodentolepis nana]